MKKTRETLIYADEALGNGLAHWCRLLGGQKVEPLLVGYPLPRVLVLRREPGWVGAEGWPACRVNLQYNMLTRSAKKHKSIFKFQNKLEWEIRKNISTFFLNKPSLVIALNFISSMINEVRSVRENLGFRSWRTIDRII